MRLATKPMKRARGLKQSHVQLQLVARQRPALIARLDKQKETCHISAGVPQKTNTGLKNSIFGFQYGIEKFNTENLKKINTGLNFNRLKNQY